jgi:D-xylose transport system permease protein
MPAMGGPSAGIRLNQVHPVNGHVPAVALRGAGVLSCVIGGTSLRGGRGTVLGVLFGALIMASLLNGMTLMVVSPEARYIARGIVLALAVWLDLRLGKGR